MKIANKVLTIIIAAIMVITTLTAIPSFAATREFPDVDPASPSAKPVYWAAENGYVNGYKNGNFGPNDNCTRQQFVVILWRMAGRPSFGTATNPFSDVESSMSSYRAILWAVNEGIIRGYDDGTFRPENPVTRAQVVTMLWRQEGRPTVFGGKEFSDVPSSISAYKPVMWGSGSGVVKGFKDGTFKPNDNCTRAQIVTFFYRYYRDVKGEDVSVTVPVYEYVPEKDNGMSDNLDDGNRASDDQKQDGGDNKKDDKTDDNTITDGDGQHIHKYTSKITKTATCKETGIKTYTCSCGDTYTESIPATGHTFGGWTTTKAATCTVAGTQTRICSACKSKETKTIKATGHKYADKVIAPTTTSQGYTLHTCSICGDSYKDSYVDKLKEPSSEHTHHWVDITKTVDHPAEYKTVHHDAEYKTVHHDAEYETIHHDAVYEWVDPVYENVWIVDSPAWDETVEITERVPCLICQGCGERFDATDCDAAVAAFIAHGEEVHGDGGLYSWIAGKMKKVVGYETIHHDETGHYESVVTQEGYNKLIKDAYDEKVLAKAAYDEKVLVKAAYDEKVLVKAAWTETVVTGQKCSECGKTK